MPLLLENVEKSYPEANGAWLRVLAVPRFELADGEQVVLVGPSGGGKTTLLNVIAGITRPDAGRVVLDDVDITRMSEPHRDRYRARKIGFVFQTFNLLPAFTALENVELGMVFANGKADGKRPRELLDRVGLAGRLTHKPAALSVGEQQRVAVARALVNRPSLLLADEPTANVDARNQKAMLDLIREACAENNVSLLLVTHQPEVAAQFPRVVPLEELNRAATAG